MKIINIIGFILPKSLKLKLISVVRKLNFHLKLSDQISLVIPQMICVDVGAAHFPHSKWQLFLRAKNTNWLAVEPNEDNMNYVKEWKWPCKVTQINSGLSKDGGLQTLFVTNVDTGSSLLPPIISPSMEHRISKINLEYFFPVKKMSIDTVTLADLLKNFQKTLPVIIKLDTQGTELSILEGAQELFNSNRIVGIELESTLLAEPIMKGSGKFWQVCEFLEKFGFELLDIDIITATSHLKKKSVRHKVYLNECDALFVLRRDIVTKLSINHKLVLLAIYSSYRFYKEVLSFLELDNELVYYLNSKGFPVKDVIAEIQKKLKVA
jgi:FkbM family methyltransferase